MLVSPLLADGRADRPTHLIPPRNQIQRKNDVIHVYACKTDNCAGPGDMTHEREQAGHGQYEEEERSST